MTTHVDILGISEQAMIMFSWIVYTVLCQTVNLFGIVTNIINIICFSKQGFEESVNISLLALSISDLGSLLTTVWICISMTPSFMTADLSFDPAAVIYLASAMPHWSFTRVSSCITAMITLERVLCITTPLKIKGIITPKRTTVITICVTIIFFCTSAPIYFVNRLGTTFDPFRNKTLIGLVSTRDREQVELISYAINNFFIPFATFVIIIVCTIVLSFKLRSQTKWRKKSTTSPQVDTVSIRNQKASKMVVMISSLFILCFLPLTIIVLTVGCIPEMSINAKFMNVSIILAGFGYLMESINSSMNICIYYNMSSKYRSSFARFIGIP